MRAARPALVALLVAAAFAACDLNPQPLPPGTEDNAGGDHDGGGFSTAPKAPDSDAGNDKGSGGGFPDAATGPADSGAPPTGDASDGGDGGDGGDAADAEG